MTDPDAAAVRAVVEQFREMDHYDVVMYDDGDPYPPSVEHLVKAATGDGGADD